MTAHGQALHDWLALKIRPMFEQRVLPVSEDVMFKWRLLVEEGRKSGHTFSRPDLIIAATALDAGRTLVTGNTAHYEWIPGLKLEDWRNT